MIPVISDGVAGQLDVADPQGGNDSLVFLDGRGGGEPAFEVRDLGSTQFLAKIMYDANEVTVSALVDERVVEVRVRLRGIETMSALHGTPESAAGQVGVGNHRR